jgi:ATP-dependent helicase HepA
MAELEPAVRSLLPSLVEAAREQAVDKASTIREAAKQAVRELIGGEARRLRELQTINDHIRDDEIVLTEQRLQDLLAVIDDANLRLDAVLLVLGQGAIT